MDEIPTPYPTVGAYILSSFKGHGPSHCFRCLSNEETSAHRDRVLCKCADGATSADS